MREWVFGWIQKPRTTDFQECVRDDTGMEGGSEGAGEEMQSRNYETLVWSVSQGEIPGDKLRQKLKN